MFWSKARKIKRLEESIRELNSTITAQALVLQKERELKIAAQNSDTAYRKIAAERGDELEKLKQELELMTASNKGAQGEAAQNAEAYGHALLKRSQEIEQLKGAYEHEFKLRREFEEELGRVRGELATLKVSPLGQIDDAVGSGVLSQTKDFTL